MLDISEGTAIRVYKQAKGETVKPKASTLQERFGFKDEELSTPKHDEIMMWLDENAERLFPTKNGNPWPAGTVSSVRARALESAKEKFPLYYNVVQPIESWRLNHTEYVERRKAAGVPDAGRPAVKTCVLPDEPPVVSLCSLKKTWEWPITTGQANNFTVGFIDMRIELRDSGLHWNWPSTGDGELSWAERSPEQFSGAAEIHLIEVKPEIRSLGEVIRQIRMYQTHVGGKFYVCCPDTRFRDQLQSQGIGFIEAGK